MMMRTFVLVVGSVLLGACSASNEVAAAADESALSADAPSTTDSLPLEGVTGDPACPTSIAVGTRGDSFSGGVRKTFDIKALIATGETLAISRPVDTQDEVVVWYGATLRADLASCTGRTATRTMFNDGSFYTVKLEDGRILVELKIDRNSLHLEVASAFANQAIFEVFEQF